ncbi:MAG: rhomboid family intramembrane serine protease [Butyrivibrio sp.]|nr:rhomboid family intramembrane serine protease [Butyrivibrio sp.]
MNVRTFESRLAGGGFGRLKTGVAETDVYIRKIRGRAYIVGVLDFGEGAADIDKISALESNLAAVYGTTDIIFVVFARDSYEARRSISNLKKYWIYNEQSGMLEIYDDQPGDFLNVRDMLEKPEATVANRIFSCNNVIIAANIVVFAILEILGDTENALFLYRHGGITADSLFNGHEVYRLFTSIFVHAGMRHIFNNMLVLFFIGNDLERAVGRIKYLIMYFGSGLVGGIVSQLYYRYSNEMYTVCVGASGAIYGIMGAMLWVLVKNKGRVENIVLPRYIIGVVLSVFIGFTSKGVSQSAHIGGLIGGFLLAVLLYRKEGLRE